MLKIILSSFIAASSCISFNTWEYKYSVIPIVERPNIPEGDLSTVSINGVDVYVDNQYVFNNKNELNLRIRKSNAVEVLGESNGSMEALRFVALLKITHLLVRQRLKL